MYIHMHLYMYVCVYICTYIYMYVYVCAYLNYSAVHWKLNNIVNQQSFKKKKRINPYNLVLKVTNLYETGLIEVSLNLWSLLVSILVTSLNHSLKGARSGTSDDHSKTRNPKADVSGVIHANILSLKLTWSDVFILWDSDSLLQSPHIWSRDSSAIWSPCQSPIFSKITL